MFSESVDNIVRAAGNRRDSVPDIERYLNMVLSRIHSKKLFDRDFHTDFIKADCKGDSMVWERPKNFRIMRTARGNGETYLNYEKVGRHLSGLDEYYYMSEESIVFCMKGIHCVEVGYYTRAAKFRYYRPDCRPAKYDQETDKWQYLVEEAGEQFYVDRLLSDVEEKAARDKVYSWLLDDWCGVVEEGALNLLWVNLGDEKATGSFAIFREGLKDIIRDEAHSSTDN